MACDGQCGVVLDVESATEPAPELTFFCSEACRAWYESEPEEEESAGDSSEHEAGCTCPACVAVVERFIAAEAEASMSLETMGEGEPWS